MFLKKSKKVALQGKYLEGEKIVGRDVFSAYWSKNPPIVTSLIKNYFQLEI
ncbi:hypothetical protein TTHERM_00540370 (macronuclear) [Tetrahymena thermophila SB210]|uniref:Uncharacterized protein n=1 Tax=Tetrahymena thermophila (strain SB210) TaxID=312017 RepID=I7LU16_TETTS|nr:hypothetical protein TTHERM_00540370 [Tetrahymena thermophila SB210]EAR87717.1 hypothetical protein TTHERM_00540370 [Tetrahymena thermophila SB210]|eukprot:XP_001007962.1 hypothetical protein TTHERM_00540370 [Tetrahymena thermophila SB210]